ncbi:MAG: heavy metal translocating P-type ATPase [Ignavibacteria bacterium]
MSKDKYKAEEFEAIELDITGMNCINCASSIQSYLSKLDGIYNVEVNFSSEIASIEYNPEIISKEDIIKDIRKMGYDVIEEDEDQTVEQQKKHQLKLHRLKIFASILLSAAIFLFSMFHHSTKTHINDTFYYTLMFLLATVSVFWCGDKFYKGAISALKNKTSDMNTLISLGVFSSYLYSVVISANHLFHLDISALNGSHEVYYETAAMIITFILIGNYLEASLKAKTQTSIKKLKELQSKYVTVIRNNEELILPFKKVKVNDIVIIKAGEKIPVDGKIIEGFGVVDESAMTGESIPIEKKKNDELLSGTVLKNGLIKLVATRVGNDTALSKIINLVKEASNTKPKIQRLADKISAVFVPVVILISIITLFAWKYGFEAPFDIALLRAVSVLIIACPCALGLASPMAVVIGIGRSAENGILFNNIEAIEKLCKVDTLCFDKTGTLTTGEIKVKNIRTFNNFDRNKLLVYVHSIEKYSNHPIAKSLYRYCIENDIDLINNIQELKNEEEGGISAIIDSKFVLIGSKNAIKKKSIDVELQSNSARSLFVAVDGELIGEIEFEDSLKPESREVIQQLIDLNYEVHLISGDSAISTEKIAKELGINNYYSSTLPEEKEQIVSRLQEAGKNVAMVGDGINDAPSLAKANVGIAVGSGQDIAIDSAELILVKSNLHSLLFAIKISRKTVSIIKQNIFWAFFYNILAIPLAAGIFGILITPVMASMMMAFSDVITVIGNSLRLKYVKLN